MTIVQPAAIAGPILRVPIAVGKFHGVMKKQGPTGWRMTSTRLARVAGDLVVAVDPQRLAREPAEELGRVGDLRLRLGHGLAHLEGHQQGELVGALVERLERAPEDLAALVGRRGRPLGLRWRRRRRAPPRRPPGSRRRPRTTARRSRGPRRASVSPSARVAPLAADVEALLDLVDDGLLLRRDAHLQTSSHGFVPKVPRRCAGTPAAYGTEGNGRRRSKRDLGSA